MTEEMVASRKAYGGLHLCSLTALMNFFVILIEELRL
jgi:hypothetical protein